MPAVGNPSEYFVSNLGHWKANIRKPLDDLPVVFLQRQMMVDSIRSFPAFSTSCKM